MRVGVEYLATATSTNDVARARLREGADLPLAVLADSQSAGRGRRGAAWQTPPGEALALTLACRAAQADSFDLTRCASLALAAALEDAGCTQVGIKWPNDVLLGDAKIGGILIESFGDRHAIGIGANLNNDSSQLADLAYPATSAADQLGRRVDREQVAAAVIGQLVGLIAELPANRKSQHRRWVRRSVLIGRRIEMSKAGRIITGTVSGLRQDGAIGIGSEGTICWHHYGSVDKILAEPSA